MSARGLYECCKICKCNLCNSNCKPCLNCSGDDGDEAYFKPMDDDCADYKTPPMYHKTFMLATKPNIPNINGKIYTEDSYNKAIEKYRIERINRRTSLLGSSWYGTNEETQTPEPVTLSNYTGLITNIDIDKGTVDIECPFPLFDYDIGDSVVTMYYDAERVSENTYDIIKIRDFYLSRKYQNGISIVDGRTIMENLQDKYPHEYTLGLVTRFDETRMYDYDKESLKSALAEFECHIGDVYNFCATVVDSVNEKIGYVKNIDMENNIITFIAKEPIDTKCMVLIPCCEVRSIQSGDKMYYRVKYISNLKLAHI